MRSYHKTEFNISFSNITIILKPSIHKLIKYIPALIKNSNLKLKRLFISKLKEPIQP